MTSVSLRCVRDIVCSGFVRGGIAALTQETPRNGRC